MTITEQTSDNIPLETYKKQFVPYMYSFYGVGGVYGDNNFTTDEIVTAMNIYISRVGTDEYPGYPDKFVADSVDRELTRDIVLNELRSKPEHPIPNHEQDNVMSVFWALLREVEERAYSENSPCDKLTVEAGYRLCNRLGYKEQPRWVT